MLTGRFNGLLVALLTAAECVAGCSEIAPDPAGDLPPDIVLITIDTLRADHLSIYGYPEFEIPGLDRLGREGVVFDSAYCEVTWTGASMASTMTGTLSPRHGLRSPYHRLAPSQHTLAERLRHRCGDRLLSPERLRGLRSGLRHLRRRVQRVDDLRSSGGDVWLPQ